MKNKYIIAITLAVMAAALYAYGPRASRLAVPRDLRDAVADAPAIDSLKEKTATEDLTSRIPEPNPSRDPRSDKADRINFAELPGETPYEKVRNLFNKGVPATEADLLGWHSGRWFHRNGRISGALLIGRVKTVSPDGGPLMVEKRFVLSGLADAEPGAFSFYSNEEFDELTTEEIKNAWRVISYHPQFTWTMKFPGAKGSHKYDYAETIEERISGGVIVERRRDNLLGEHLSTGVTAHSAALSAAEPYLVESYAYYFKDVTPGK